MKMYKQQFPLLVKNKQMTYLDSAATSQCPQVVIDELTNSYESIKANAHRGQYLVSVQATEKLERARNIFAQFIGAHDDEIVFTKNTTEAINNLARTLPLQEGDEVLVSEIEHHSNYVPWQQVAKKVGATFSVIPYDIEKEELDFHSDLISSKTKIVSITGMSNLSGLIVDVKDIIKRIRKKNPQTIIIVDACQLAPHKPIDVKDMDADFVVFSAHKMFGPFGVGILYGKQQLLEGLEPFLFGGSMVGRVTQSETTWAAIPQRFEAGTLDVPSIVAAAKAVTFMQEIGWEALQQKEDEITQLALEKLRMIEGVQVIGHNNKQQEFGPIISFTVEGIASDDIATICNHKQVAVRSGKHCAEPFLQAAGLKSTIRASFSIYNNPEDVDVLVQSLQEAINIFKKK